MPDEGLPLFMSVGDPTTVVHQLEYKRMPITSALLCGCKLSSLLKKKTDSRQPICLEDPGLDSGLLVGPARAVSPSELWWECS